MMRHPALTILYLALASMMDALIRDVSSTGLGSLGMCPRCRKAPDRKARMAGDRLWDRKSVSCVMPRYPAATVLAAGFPEPRSRSSHTLLPQGETMPKSYPRSEVSEQSMVCK